MVKETLAEFDQYIAEYRETAITAAAAGTVIGSESTATVTAALEGLSLSTTTTAAADSSTCAAKQKEQHQQKEEVDDEDDDEDSDSFNEEDEEQPYTAADVLVVERCLAVIRAGFNCLKTTLAAVTTVSDSIAGDVTAARDPIELLALTELERHCEVWVGSLTRQANAIQDSCIDVGSELYPPLDTSDGSIDAQLDTLRNHILSALDLLSKDLFSGHLGADLAASVQAIKNVLL